MTNLARTLKDLQTKGRAVGTTGEAEKTIYDVDLTGLSYGNGLKGTGMRKLQTSQCDFLAKLPMAGKVSSLNVSVAAGVCLYEAVRQRN